MKKYLYKRVMIIDDSNLDRYISKSVVQRSAFGEEISTFSSAVSAIDYLKSLPESTDAFPQIIFLDINMPVMDGFGFVDQYMKLPAHLQEQCHIVMISSTNSPEDFARINTYPAICLFFNKPLSDRILFNVKEYMKGNILR